MLHALLENAPKIGSVFMLGGGAVLLLSAHLAPKMLKSTLVRRLVEYVGNVDVPLSTENQPVKAKGSSGVV
jgi:phage FluMu protein gp41